MSSTNLSTISHVRIVTFENTDLRIIDRNGCAWLTGADLSRALGYAKSTKVTDLYNRNKHEFNDDMTALVTLDTSEVNSIPSMGIIKAGAYQTRVYSSRGSHLVAMLSRTEKAGMFRRWVLDVLENLNHSQASKPVVSKQELPSFLQSKHGKILFKDAVTSSAYHLLTHGDFKEEQRYMQERIDKRVASRMEDIACHENEGLRLLMEADGIGGFDTRQIMPGIHLLENKQLAEHILSAKGPMARYIPAIMQACAQRMQEVCDLPLAGVEIEGLDS